MRELLVSDRKSKEMTSVSVDSTSTLYHYMIAKALMWATYRAKTNLYHKSQPSKEKFNSMFRFNN